jgi:hypothetical protein
VLVAGGAVYGQSNLARQISAALKNDFPLHRVLGAKDITAAGVTGVEGYDALGSARTCHAFYAGPGRRRPWRWFPALPT